MKRTVFILSLFIGLVIASVSSGADFKLSIRPNIIIGNPYTYRLYSPYYPTPIVTYPAPRVGTVCDCGATGVCTCGPYCQCPECGRSPVVQPYIYYPYRTLPRGPVIYVPR